MAPIEVRRFTQLDSDGTLDYAWRQWGRGLHAGSLPGGYVVKPSKALWVFSVLLFVPAISDSASFEGGAHCRATGTTTAWLGNPYTVQGPFSKGTCPAQILMNIEGRLYDFNDAPKVAPEENAGSPRQVLVLTETDPRHCWYTNTIALRLSSREGPGLGRALLPGQLRCELDSTVPLYAPKEGD